MGQARRYGRWVARAGWVPLILDGHCWWHARRRY
jgi:hypothetical protein